MIDQQTQQHLKRTHRSFFHMSPTHSAGARIGLFFLYCWILTLGGVVTLDKALLPVELFLAFSIWRRM